LDSSTVSGCRENSKRRTDGTILGVPMQDVILDPVKLLTAALSNQVIKSMVVINVSTAPTACPAANDHF
jgi:hypothetical protein